jgi:hypothetical protein
MRKRVYRAGPIVKGDLGNNIARATDAMHELMRAGLAPFCPHLSCFSGFMARTWTGKPYVQAEVLPRELGIEHWYETDLAWVAVAEAVLRLPGEGKGSDAEVAFAVGRGIPVFRSVAEVIAWAGAA